MENVTEKLLHDLQYAVRGEDVKRVLKAAPAKKLTPTLQAELDRFRDPRTDRTMGYVSNALAYSSSLRRDKKRHADIIRLIKGGYLAVYQIGSPPPPGSNAAHESRYSTSYYVLEVV